MRQYSAEGQALGDALEIDTPNRLFGQQSVDVLSDDTFILTWDSSAGPEIFQRHFDASGTELSSAVTVSDDFLDISDITESLHCQTAVASSRKPVGIGLAQKYGIPPDALDLTYLVIQNGKVLTKSDASLGLLAELKAPWRYFGVLRIVPRGFRNWIYDIVARNRLRWFGEEKDCFLPTPAQRSKFLDHLPSHREPTERPE